MKTSNEEPPPNVESRSSTPPTTTPPTYSSTPSSNVARATLAGSRADYSCYTIRGNNNDILAVVIETKMSRSSQDALAQVYPFYIPTVRVKKLFFRSGGDGKLGCLCDKSFV